MNEQLKDLIKASKQPLSAFQIARSINSTEKEIQPILDDLCEKSILEKLRVRTAGAYAKINNYYRLKK
jgi:DNA-binding PadR family transcriptional regulator